MGRLRGITSTVGVALLLTGCSTTVAGTPIGPSSTAARLDTGNYPTKPRTVVAKTDADAWQQEGWKVADAVVNPREIDPEISTTATGSLPVFDTGYFTTKNGQCILTRQNITDLGPGQVLTGFMARATSADKQKGLTIGLLRFRDDAAARRAVQVLEPVATGNCGTKAVRVEVSFAGAGMVAVAAAFTEGTTKPDTATQTRLTAAAIEAQVKNRVVYAPGQLVPGASRPRVDMDIDGIVSRTIKTADPSYFGLSDETGMFGGWMTPHTFELSMGATGRLGGLQLVGRTILTSVLRFKDEAAATAAANSVLLGGTPQSVPGVPDDNARCVPRDGFMACVAQVGRHLTLVNQATDVQARQAISAAYLILKAAGDK
ncbi:Uncharacterised protein (plasmid) [Tsukamurella tyrosinosolvens]|uniref:DUF7373 domain-containing protein n=1 Tax=Tsukamurella tyrosinosolvens TaxID=57704 RepID=A0A1H4I6Z1_TSUTY|nr:hypothetical protein [Tsukamurella tyrosinosolvens]KXO98817.1 hypothetical protein AXK58_24415 [Tsukamurella tyrosinosolvens]SEB29711.1 hypothetical protein SAMN04489793_0045 [Tsukamurella tyrosinosolvens]VEH95823.1 Uncharacterised protein [Tsukamurella tyrosinosolvens]